MPLREETPFNRCFQRRLAELRGKIECLPEGRRAWLSSLADQAEQQHDQMQRECARVRDLIDDMRLKEVSVRFGLWAAAADLRAALGPSEWP